MSLHAPVGWEYQHGETGRITVCINDGVNDRDSLEQLNPRHHYVGPLYRHPVGSVQVDEALVFRFLNELRGQEAAVYGEYKTPVNGARKQCVRAALNFALNPGGSRE